MLQIMKDVYWKSLVHKNFDMIRKNSKIYLPKVLFTYENIFIELIDISSIGLDFLQGMLVYDTVHRRTMGELTVHPWLTVDFN